MTSVENLGEKLEIQIPLTRAGQGVEMEGELPPKKLAKMYINIQELMTDWVRDEHTPLESVDPADIVRLLDGDVHGRKALVLLGHHLPVEEIRSEGVLAVWEEVDLPRDGNEHVPAAEVVPVEDLDAEIAGWSEFTPERVFLELLGTEVETIVYPTAKMEAVSTRRE